MRTSAQTILESQKRGSILVWSDVAGYQNRDGQSLESSKKKVVGEPDEGKPHVRFDVAGDGNQDMVMVLRHSQKKWRATGCFHLRLRRHPLTLPADSSHTRTARFYEWQDYKKGFQGPAAADAGKLIRRTFANSRLSKD
jgi:hypothetical protein